MNNNDIKCVKCGYTDHSDGAIYCQNCGTVLNNYCPDQQCEANNVDDPEYACLKSDARYCPYCGTKTTHFEFLSDDTHKNNNN